MKTDYVCNNKVCRKYCVSVENYATLRSDIWRLFITDNKRKHTYIHTYIHTYVCNVFLKKYSNRLDICEYLNNKRH